MVFGVRCSMKKWEMSPAALDRLCSRGISSLSKGQYSAD